MCAIVILKQFRHAGLSSIFLKEGFRPSRNDNLCGFTFLELIVALFLISLVAAVVLPSFSGVGERKLKSEAQEIASILRFVHDSAVSRKEPYWITFDLDGNLVAWKSPEGRKSKRFEHLTGLKIQSAGTVSRGEVTIMSEPLGFREDISVYVGTGDENITIAFNYLSGKVKIKENL
jgi:prepilin-type N-terminal cleavage/methylation domain-containing protein